MATPIPTGRRVERGVQNPSGAGAQGSQQIAPGDINVPGVQRDPGLDVRPSQFGSQVGQALEGLGQEFGHIAAARQQLEDRRKAVEDSIFLARARSELNQRLYQSTIGAQQAVQTGDNFLDHVTPLYDEARSGTLADLRTTYNPSDEALGRYEQMAVGLQENYSLKAITFENNEKVAAYRNQLNDEVNNLAESVIENGDIKGGLDALDETLEGFRGVLTPSEFEEVADASRRQLAIAYGEGRLRKDPGGARAIREGFLGFTPNSVMGALIDQESNGNPNAVSHKGATGLTQVMPDTGREIAKELGDQNFPHGGTKAEVQAYLKDEAVSIRYGTFYLQKMFRRYGGDVEAALVAYNGGPKRADKWIAAGKDDSVLPKETREYYKAVLARVQEGGDEGLDLAAKHLSFEDQLSFVDRAARANDVQIEKFNDRFKNHVANIESYGVGLEGFAANTAQSFTDPATFADIKAQEQQAFRDHSSFQSIRFGGPAEARAAVQEAQPVPGSADIIDQQNRFQRYQDAFQERVNATVSAAGSDSFDPADYVREGFPDVRDAYQEALQSQEPEALDNAIRTSLAAQRELGVAHVDQRALPTQATETIVTDLMRTPADQRFLKMKQLEQQFGSHWDQVFSEMVDAGLDPTTELLGLVSDNPVDAELVTKVIGVEAKDLKANIDDATIRDIETRVEEEMAPFMRAVEAGAFEDVNLLKSNRIVEAMKKVALQHYRDHRDEGEAVERSTSLIDKRFQVLESSNMNVLAPADVSASDVENVLTERQTREAIEDFDPLAPGDPGAPDFLDKTRIVSTAANSGMWIKNERGDGAVLVVPFPGGGQIVLRNQDGEPYEVTWDEITRQGATIRTRKIEEARDLRRRGMGTPELPPDSLAVRGPGTRKPPESATAEELVLWRAGEALGFGGPVSEEQIKSTMRENNQTRREVIEELRRRFGIMDRRP